MNDVSALSHDRFATYPHLRGTGAEWMPRVPAHWTDMRLGGLGTLVSGGTPSSEREEYWNGDIPWVSPKDMKVPTIYDSIDHLSAAGVRAASLKSIPSGSVLFVVRGMILARTFPVAVTGCTVTINQDMKALLPRSGVHAPFLHYMLQGMKSKLLAITDEAGHGTMRLRMELWKACHAFLPSFTEQQAIAAFLDKETLMIDALLTKQERAIDVLREGRDARVADALVGGVGTEVEFDRTNIPWIAQLPSHWGTRRLKFLLKQVQLPAPDESGVVTVFRDGQVTLRTNRRMDGFTLAIKEVGYQGVRVGQLVVHSMDAFAGAIGVSESDGKCTPEYVVCDARSSDIVLEYYAQCLRLMAHRGYIQVCCPSVRERAPRLRFGDLGDMLVPVPPHAEQESICRMIEEVTATTQRAAALCQRAIEELTELKSALIYSATTGQIDVREEVTA